MGDGAVAEAVHLVEAARLEARGHELEIAGGLDAVGQAGVKPNFDGAVGGVALGEAAKGALIFAAAAAEEDELHAGGEHFLEGAQLDVHALLIGEAGDAAEEGDVGRDGQA